MRSFDTLEKRLLLAADVNHDYSVDIFDVAAVSAAWGSADPGADANGDGVVDIFDVAKISNAWRPIEQDNDLLFWLDADNPNALEVVDEAIASWGDQAGGVVLSQPSPVDRPQLVDVSGHVGVRHDPDANGAHGDYLAGEAPDFLSDQSHGGIVIAITIPNDYRMNQFSTLFNSSDVETQTGYFFLETYPVDGQPRFRIRWRFENMHVDLRGDTVLVPGQTYVCLVKANGFGLGYSMWVNGHQETFSGGLTQAGNGAWYGDLPGRDVVSTGSLIRSDGVSDFGDTILHEVRVYSDDASLAKLHAAEAEMIAKWVN